MVERKPYRRLPRGPREGERKEIETEILQERAVGVGKLTQGFREVAESDEDG